MIINNYIVFEGIDGAGTTTQIKKLSERLEKYFSEDKVVMTNEPTGNETGKFLRRMLKGEFSVSEKTASYLFAADRCEHLFGKGGIVEQTQGGKIVLCDRYIFSSLAYQSVSCGKELPEMLNSPFPLPQILFYFKINPEVSLKRVQARNGQLEIYEKLDFQKKTADLYDSIIQEYINSEKGKGMTVVTVDAEKTVEEISDFIFTKTKEILKLN